MKSLEVSSLTGSPAATIAPDSTFPFVLPISPLGPFARQRAEMGILEWISGLMQGEEFAIPGQAMAVLDGENFEKRLAVGLDLLGRGFAPLLIISLGRMREGHVELAEKTAAVRPGKIRLLYHEAPSIWHEAAELRACLQNVICARLVVVAPWYQARRIRLIFDRTLKDDGIVAMLCPVRPSRTKNLEHKLDPETRKAILMEPFRWLAAWLRRGLPPVPAHAATSPEERKAA